PARKRLEAKGLFPPPIPLFEGSRSQAYIESEIDKWTAATIAAARGAPPANGNGQPPESSNGNGHGPEPPPPARGSRQAHGKRQAQPPPRRPERSSARGQTT